jgi:hypothetical protein
MSPQNSPQHSGYSMNARPGATTDQKSEDERKNIPESVADDHARLLSVLGQCLAEVGFRSGVTTVHKITLCAESFHRPVRYEPELDVFWPDDQRPGTAMRIRLVERAGRSCYAWGEGWVFGHPAGDLVGVVQAVVGRLSRSVR